MTFAATLIGHHVVTMRLLKDGLLNVPGRIVIAGSEGARGNVMNMKLPDFTAFAAECCDILTRPWSASPEYKHPTPFTV